MKIKKSTIVWFALAALFLGCFFFVKDYDNRLTGGTQPM